MCFSSGGGGSTAAITEQLNKNNVTLSNSKVASGTAEKETKKRTVSSLRVPIKPTDTGKTGINTADATAATTGLNIPV